MSSSFSLDTLADIARAIFELGAILFAPRQEDNRLTIHQFHLSEIQDYVIRLILQIDECL